MIDNSIKSISNPKISACIIVRNEEKFLAQCLKSIQKYVDEIIIVDTGSQDKTIEIAESFGAKVYIHPWEDNFSKHRNQSFGYAKMDWILYIDADEELLQGSGELLKKSVSKAGTDIDAIAVTLECIFNKGLSMSYNNSVRLFRNNCGFYYKGRVHNYIVGVKNVLCYPIRLFHHGYNLDKSTTEQKFDRTTKLLKMDIIDDPDDPRPHHYLSVSYLSASMNEEALEESLISIALAEKIDDLSHIYFWSIYIAASACLNLRKLDQARDLAEKGIRLFPDHLDSYYVLSFIAYETHDSVLFDHYFNHYIRVIDAYQNNPEKFGEVIHNNIGSRWLLHLLRAFFIEDDGPGRNAEPDIKAAISLCPDPYSIYLKLGNYYLNKNRLLDAEYNFLKAKEKNPINLEPIKLLSTVYKLAGKDTEQKEALEEALKINSTDPDCLFSLGLIYMKRNEPQKALSCFEAISQMPDNIRVVMNKAICLREMKRFNEVISLLTGVESEDKSLNCIILSNLAFSLKATGNMTEAVNTIEKLNNLDFLDPYPSIFLSRVYLDQMDIETLVRECSRLLNHLMIKEQYELNSIEDLTRCYLHVSRGLMNANKPRQYIEECLEISLMLAGNTPSLMVDIGEVFLDIGLLKTGTEILKKALLLTPSDKALIEHITSIIRPINSDIIPRI